jgi:molecular chaperone GrpE
MSGAGMNSHNDKSHNDDKKLQKESRGKHSDGKSSDFKNHNHDSINSRISLDEGDNTDDSVLKEKHHKNQNNSNENHNSLLEELKIAKEVIENLKHEHEKEKNKLLLEIAERENLFKRIENKQKDDLLFANQSILKSLVEPLEQLFLALMQKPSDDDKAEYKNMYLGVEMTKDEIMKCLTKFGLRRVFPINEVFNPSFHQAISVIEDSTLQSGMIKNVVKAGYELNGRLVNPALVIVVK